LAGSTHTGVTNNADANTSSKAAEAIGEARCEVGKPEVIRVVVLQDLAGHDNCAYK